MSLALRHLGLPGSGPDPGFGIFRGEHVSGVFSREAADAGLSANVWLLPPVLRIDIVKTALCGIYVTKLNAVNHKF
jgi:hypothetical protein